METATTLPAAGESAGELKRTIDWKGAFWVASGVPVLVLFSIGGIAGTVGIPAFMVWAVSVMFGFIQAFTYAEVAGLFPSKAGGVALSGGAAWLKYSKLIGPLSLWSYWLAWTPVLSLGCTIAASYILNSVAPIPSATSEVVKHYMAAHAGVTADQAVAALTPLLRSWSLFSVNLFGVVHLSIAATFFIGAVLMLICFAIQDRGILSTAQVQLVIALMVVVPMVIIALAPLFNGQFSGSNFTPFVPLKTAGAPAPGHWDNPGWTLMLGGLFIAGWSTYAFETAICYTREFKNPGTDVFKAIFYSGLLCILLFVLVPFTFQGVLGVTGMLDPSIVDGSGVASAMASMVGGGAFIHGLLVLLMILAILLSITTAMAGTSRTLYQGSIDGWLPRYLSHINPHGAPTRAMWTDFTFNMILLSFASSDANAYFLILAVSNVGYFIFNFLILNAGWIHRIDAGHIDRPWKAPSLLVVAGVVLGFIDLVLLGAGAKVWNPIALWAGLGTVALIIPVFYFRHYMEDGGKFPAHLMEDLGLAGGSLGERKAGALPYLLLISGLAVILLANWIFHL